MQRREEKGEYHPPRLQEKEDPVRIRPELDPFAPLKEKAQIYADVTNLSLSLSKRKLKNGCRLVGCDVAGHIQARLAIFINGWKTLMADHHRLSNLLPNRTKNHKP